MARRKKSEGSLDALAGLVALMPWWAGVALAVVSYFGLHAFAISPMPVATGTGQMGALVTGSMWRAFASAGQYLVPLVCLVGAGMSLFERRKANELHNDAANRADGIAQMSWREFELLVGEYFRRQGFTVSNNGGGGADGGVDVWLTRGADRYLVQCKHWRDRRVGVESVREMYGLIAAQRLAGGYVVTSGDFTDEARRFAEGRELMLINGAVLQRGVREQAVTGAAHAGMAGPRATAEPGRVDRPIAKQPTMPNIPACPKCGAAMTPRVARQGANAGKQFWGCSQFGQTKCRGTRQLA